MEILANSIKDITDKFEDLENKLQGCNYGVAINGRTFSFINNDILTKSDLDFLLHEIKLVGHLEISTWDKLKEVILYHLTFCGTDQGIDIPEEMLRVVDTDTAQHRVEQFWSIINNYVSLPPTEVYFYHAHEDCYFAFEMMWRFGFVLINKTTKTGVFIDMSASD